MGLFNYPKRRLRKLAHDGDYKEAIDFGKSIEEKYSNDADFLFIMGSISYMVGDAKNSLSYFDKALQINEYDIETLLLKAHVHLFLKEFLIAVECLNKILKVDSGNNEAKQLLEKIPK